MFPHYQGGFYTKKICHGNFWGKYIPYLSAYTAHFSALKNQGKIVGARYTPIPASRAEFEPLRRHIPSAVHSGIVGQARLLSRKGRTGRTGRDRERSGACMSIPECTALGICRRSGSNSAREAGIERGGHHDGRRRTPDRTRPLMDDGQDAMDDGQDTDEGHPN